MFFQEVDKRSRKDMVDFLKNHFRYHTMNCWNNSTSYANNVKLYNHFNGEELSKAFEILEQGSVFDEINLRLQDFDIEHDHTWQTGFNGRSQGYIVLYHGGRHSNGSPYSNPGKNTDMNAQFEEWDIQSLKERVKLVQEFDQMCDDVADIFNSYVKTYNVEEKEIMVPMKIKVLVEMAQ